jgi:hypothetical protein
VKKLLEKVTVHDDYLEFRFKSGVTISIEMWIDRATPASLTFSGAGLFLLFPYIFLIKIIDRHSII